MSGGFEEFTTKFPQLLEGKKAAVYQGKVIVKPISPKKEPERLVEEPKLRSKTITEKITDINSQIWGKGKANKPKEITSKITGESYLNIPGSSSNFRE